MEENLAASFLQCINGLHGNNLAQALALQLAGHMLDKVALQTNWFDSKGLSCLSEKYIFCGLLCLVSALLLAVYLKLDLLASSQVQIYRRFWVQRPLLWACQDVQRFSTVILGTHLWQSGLCG